MVFSAPTRSLEQAAGNLLGGQCMPQPGVRAAAEIVEPGHCGHRSRHLKEQAAFHVVTLDGRGDGLWFQGNCRIVAA